MKPQDGDHFAHPLDDPDVISHNRAIVVAIAGEEFASSIFGIPSRDRRDEDRAQEARRGARAMRQRGWMRYVAMLDPYLYPVLSASVRTFVPTTPHGDAGYRFLYNRWPDVV